MMVSVCTTNAQRVVGAKPVRDSATLSMFKGKIRELTTWISSCAYQRPILGKRLLHQEFGPRPCIFTSILSTENSEAMSSELE